MKHVIRMCVCAVICTLVLACDGEFFMDGILEDQSEETSASDDIKKYESEMSFDADDLPENCGTGAQICHRHLLLICLMGQWRAIYSCGRGERICVVDSDHFACVDEEDDDDDHDDDDDDHDDNDDDHDDDDDDGRNDDDDDRDDDDDDRDDDDDDRDDDDDDRDDDDDDRDDDDD